MPEDDDPIAHGHEAAVQTVTVLATLAGEMARRSAVRVQTRSDELARSDVRTRVQQSAGRARDAVRWSPMLDRNFRSGASVADGLDAWNAAAGWVDRDPQAARSSRLAETVLRRADPAAMAVYDNERAGGVDHRAAAAAAGLHIGDLCQGADERRLNVLVSAITLQADAHDLAQGRSGTPIAGAAAAPVDESALNRGETGSRAGTTTTDRIHGAGATLDVRRPSGVSVDFPVVINTVPIRMTPTGPGDATPSPATPSPTHARRPGSAR